MQAKLIVTFERLSEADFLAKTGLIIASLTGNAAFPEPWPAPVPSLAQLGEARNAYESAYHASQSRDIFKIAQRDEARQTLTQQIKHLASYLETIAQGDTQILAGTGYDLRRDMVRGASTGLLPAPEAFHVAHGGQSGTLELQCAKVPGARSYEIQITQGDPGVEANWKHVLTVATSKHILLEALIPTQSHWLRIRAIGSDGGGVWSDPVSVIVV